MISYSHGHNEGQHSPALRIGVRQGRSLVSHLTGRHLTIEFEHEQLRQGLYSGWKVLSSAYVFPPYWHSWKLEQNKCTTYSMLL